MPGIGKDENGNFNIKKLNNIFSNASTSTLFQKISSESCINRMKVPIDIEFNSTKLKTFQNPVDLFNLVKSNLSKNRPVLAGISGNVLQDPIDSLLNPINPMEIDNKFRHYINIIGQRRNPKTKVCQFLVRNSWSEVEISQKRRCDRIGLSSEKTECETNGGNYWMDEEFFKNNFFEIIAIK